MYTPFNPAYNSLFTGVFANQNWSPGIALLGRGFSQPYRIIEELNPGGSIPFTHPDSLFQTAFEPLQYVVQQIASVNQAGTNLVLTWTDPNYDAFREKMIIQDDNLNLGYVVSSSAGTVTISPSTSGPLDATLHFQVGMYALDQGNAAGDHSSSGVQTLYKTLGYRNNWSAILRESHQFSSKEKMNIIKNNVNGVEETYAYSDGERQMVERFLERDLLKMMYSKGGVFTNAIEGVTHQFEGARDAVMNQGGRFVSSAALPTRADIIADLDFLASKDPSYQQNFGVIAGRAYRRNINNIFAGDIGFTQSRAVINGNELNFDVPKLTIDGVTIQFFDQWGGIFDNRTQFPAISGIAAAGNRRSNTAFMLNLSPLPNKGGGTIPAVRKFHYSMSKVTGGDEIMYRYYAGMIGTGEGNSTGGPMQGKYQQAGSSIMGAGLEIAKDAGYDFAGDASVWRELGA